MDTGQAPTARVTPDAAARLIGQATTAAVAAACLMIAAKAFAWVATDSVSVLSSLIDSLLDAAASLVNLVAVRHALTPADREHRFGHGKAEAIAGLAQAAFISGSALLLFHEAVTRLFNPVPLASSTLGIAVMAFSIVVTLALVVFQRFVVRRTGSVAIGADSLHYKGDLLTNGSVIVALGAGAGLGWTLLDPVFGLAIGAYILHSAWTIARAALEMLMDRELPNAERERIRAIALGHPEVRNVHDLRTRASGSNIFVQFHIELDADMRLTRAHEVADDVEAAVIAAFPSAEVLIHQDPTGIDERRKTF
jgi:ferrous-iron efflux pump FieF